MSTNGLSLPWVGDGVSAPLAVTLLSGVGLAVAALWAFTTTQHGRAVVFGLGSVLSTLFALTLPD